MWMAVVAIIGFILVVISYHCMETYEEDIFGYIGVVIGVLCLAVSLLGFINYLNDIGDKKLQQARAAEQKQAQHSRKSITSKLEAHGGKQLYSNDSSTAIQLNQVTIIITNSPDSREPVVSLEFPNKADNDKAEQQ